jgi:hypothetical protein
LPRPAGTWRCGRPIDRSEIGNIDTGIALDGEISVDDGLRESNAAADIENVGFREVLQTQPLEREIDQDLTGMLRGEVRYFGGVPIQAIGDDEARLSDHADRF